MLGDLQRKKAHYYFDLIDENDNDYIEADDFAARADRLSERRDLDEEEDRQRLRQQVLGWWTALCTAIDKNSDDRVSRDEWLRFWESIQTAVEQGDPEDNTALDSLSRSAHVTFEAIDTTGNGNIQEDEYTDWLSAWGADHASEAFHRLDRTNKGFLTEDDLVKATLEFYLSNDPEAPGNALFGPLPE